MAGALENGKKSTAQISKNRKIPLISSEISGVCNKRSKSIFPSFACSEDNRSYPPQKEYP